MKKMEFISGGGKMFELAKALANAVLNRLGEESDLLQLLNPKRRKLLNDLADVLTGRSVITKRPLKDVVGDITLSLVVRADALKEANDPDLAWQIYKAETAPENGRSRSYSNKLTQTATSLIIDENKLLGIALSRSDWRLDDALIAAQKITDQGRLRRIVEENMWANIVTPTLPRLTDLILVEIIEKSTDMNLVNYSASILGRRNPNLIQTMVNTGKTAQSREAAMRVMISFCKTK